MIYLQVIIASVISIIVLFLITKIIGYRQVSELSMFDYINSITIGSIAAEAALGDKENIAVALIAMTIFGIFTLILSMMTDKSIAVRRFVEGVPIILMQNGKMYEKSFKKARVDINEFLAQCRINGYYNLSEINTAILEPNGKISFLPFAKYEPVTNEGMQKAVNDKRVCPNIILDGKVMYENLKNSGYDENWLISQLHGMNVDTSEIVNRNSSAKKEKNCEKSGGCIKLNDIFLANEENGTLCIYTKQGVPQNEIFE